MSSDTNEVLLLKIPLIPRVLRPDCPISRFLTSRPFINRKERKQERLDRHCFTPSFTVSVFDNQINPIYQQTLTRKDLHQHQLEEHTDILH